MRILQVYTHYPVSSGRYMTDAFQRLGHDVRHVGDSTGAAAWGMQVDPKYAHASDGGITTYWPDWTPDLVLLMDSAFAFHHPFYPNVPHAVYGVDNHVRNYRQYGISRYFLGHKAVSIQPFEADCEWLPCAYDPMWFTQSTIQWEHREYDVALIGVLYPRRVELLNALAKAGLKVAAGTGALYGEYRDIYQNARISLCVSAASDVAQRVFETAAMGCWVLTDPLPDLDEVLNDPEGKTGVSVFNSTEEAIELAKWAIDWNWPARGGSYEALGFMSDWVRPHTWDSRAQRIVDWWTAEYAPKPKGKGRKGDRDATPTELDSDRVAGAPEGDGDGAPGDGGAGA